MNPGFLHAPMKKTVAVDFVKPLDKYIRNTFSAEVANENKDSVAELNQLRTNAVIRALDKHETSLEIIQRYYDQLVTMEAKLPISEDGNRITFTWEDAFDKGSIFGVTKCGLISGAYERFCVLFNTAALFSQIAASKPLHGDDLKTAAKYYQQSAGIFTYLKDNVFPVLQTLPTPDFAVGVLSCLSSVMLAQGQEAIYLKASSDKMKDALVAKVASQLTEFYKEASRNANQNDCKGMLPPEWLKTLSAKQHYYLAVAEFHQSNTCLAVGSYGEQVARLQQSMASLKEVEKLDGNGLAKQSNFLDMSATVTQLARTAEKDNSLIYNDRVGPYSSYQAIGKAALAKALPFSSPMSSNFQDLFTRLVPSSVHQSMRAYDSYKADIINENISKLREATNDLNGILASLNLPAALEDMTGGSSVPASLMEKATEVQAKGGLTTIDQMMQNLPDLLQRNREVLNEAFNMLDEEEREDTAMREHFKERWCRTESSKLTGQLREEGGKYKNILDNATNADGVVKDKYNQHRRGLDILNKGQSGIADSLPPATVNMSADGAAAAQNLQQLMTRVAESKKRRNELEEEFKGATADMQSKFLQALAAEGFLDTERLIKTNAGEVYDPLKTEVDEICNDQNEILDHVKAEKEKLDRSKGNAPESPRESLLKELAASYDAYIELSSNLQEGSKFYNDLTEILLKFQAKCSDLVFARKTEKDDLSKDLQQTAAKAAPTATPPPPAHHAAAKTSVPGRPPQPQSRAPPCRPPPPQQSAPPPQQQSYQQPPQQQPYQQQSHPQAGQQPPHAQAGQQPAYNPYPQQQQQQFMPQPGYYAPPGGMAYQPYGYQAYAPPGGYQAPPPVAYPPGQPTAPGYGGYQPYQQQQPPRQ